MIRLPIALLLMTGLLSAQPGLDPGGELRLQATPAILGGALGLQLSGQPGADWILALAALPGARQALIATLTPGGVLLVGGGDAGDPGATPPIPAVIRDTAEIWTPLP